MIHLRAVCSWSLLAMLTLAGCERRSEPAVPDDQSSLKAATDVYWALQRWEYLASKDKPPEPSRGCQPTEYVVQKGELDQGGARFQISVFECPDARQAAEIVEHPGSRKVDSLLRNDKAGGILRRNKLQLIVRRTHGPGEAAEELLRLLEGT
jgi:hypothetical protein